MQLLSSKQTVRWSTCCSFLYHCLIEDVLTILGFTDLRCQESCENPSKRAHWYFWQTIHQTWFEVILTSIDTIQKVLQAGKAADVSISRVIIAWWLLVITIGIVYTDLLLGENEEGGNEEEQTNSMIPIIGLIFLSASGDIHQFAKSDCWRIDRRFYRSVQGRM